MAMMQGSHHKVTSFEETSNLLKGPHKEQTLSTEDDAADDSEGQSKATTPIQPRRHLIWAGESADLRHLVNGLKNRFDVEIATDGIAALEAAQIRRPDLILSHVTMPRLDGLGLLKSLRADPALHDTPFILISMQADEDDWIEGMEAGADDYLIKPFSTRELLTRAESTIRMASARRKMDRALRASEERYRAIVESQVEMVCRFRLDGTILFVNGAYARARNTTPELLNRANFWDFIEPEDRPAVRAMLDQLRPESPQIQIENRFETSEGVRWTFWTNHGLAFDEHGRATEVQSSGIDITDRKLAEQAMRDSQAKLSAIVEQLPVGVGTVDRQGRTLSLNPEGLRLHGFTSLDEMLVYLEQYTASFKLYDLDGRPIPQDQWPLVRALRGDYVHNYEVELHPPAGTAKIVSYSAVPVFGGEDSENHIVFVMHDMTDRKQAEQALRQSEERLRLAAQSAHFGTYDMEIANKRIFWSNEAKAIAGLPQNSAPLSIDEVLDIVHPEDRAYVRSQMAAAADAQGEGQFEAECRLLRTDGSIPWVMVKGRTFFDEVDGQIQPTRAAGILLDITDRKKAEADLRHLNESLELRVEERTHQVRTLASRLTMAEQEERRRISQILHDDLQQLLYGVEMKMDIIRQDLEQTEHEVLMKDLQEGISWLKQAIATTRQLTVEISPPILQNEGLVNALEWLQHQMHDLHGITVTVEAAHRFHIPNADLRVLLFQIVRELLFNVKKHAGVNRATVKLSEEADQLCIQVYDEGKGFQVAENATSLEPVEGFGLYTIRERLNLLGGRMEIHSTPGAGTQIDLYAPLHLDAVSAPVA